MAGTTLKEVAIKLNCTESNVSWLLRHGVLHGVKENNHWVISEEDITEYLHREKKRRQPMYVLHPGDTFGYWTVIDPDRYKKSEKRKALCRCVCGKEKLVWVFNLIHKKSISCGCKRILEQTQEQKENIQNGREVMKEIQKKKIMAGLPRSLNKNSTTGHKGVNFMPKIGKYRAYIMVNRKQIHLGCFTNLDDAIRARKAAEEKYFAPFREKINEIKGKMKDDNKK